MDSSQTQSMRPQRERKTSDIVMRDDKRGILWNPFLTSINSIERTYFHPRVLSVCSCLLPKKKQSFVWFLFIYFLIFDVQPTAWTNNGWTCIAKSADPLRGWLLSKRYVSLSQIPLWKPCNASSEIGGILPNTSFSSEIKKQKTDSCLDSWRLR